MRKRAALAAVILAATAAGCTTARTVETACYPVGAADVDALPANLATLGVDYVARDGAVCVAVGDADTVARERAAIAAAGGYVPA